MSRASLGVTPRLGMAVLSSSAGGFWIQLIRLSGVFRTTPPTNARLPMRSSGGPTSASALRTPGIVWHDPQPYSAIRSRPRPGSPLVIDAATDQDCFCASRYTPASATALPTARTTSAILVKVIARPREMETSDNACAAEGLKP